MKKLMVLTGMVLATSFAIAMKKDDPCSKIGSNKSICPKGYIHTPARDNQINTLCTMIRDLERKNSCNTPLSQFNPVCHKIKPQIEYCKSKGK